MLATAASRIEDHAGEQELAHAGEVPLADAAMVAMVKKMAPVPPAAMAIIEPPLEKPRATCRMRKASGP